MSADCKGCGISVRLSEAEVRRLIADYFGPNAPPLADGAEAARRLALCAQCPDLRYSTTCAHCGCLVPILTRIATKSCPHPVPRWLAITPTPPPPATPP